MKEHESITVGYGLGRNYEKYKKMLAELEVTFSFLADSKWEDGSSEPIDGIPIIAFKDLKELINVKIVFFLDNPSIFHKVSELFPNAKVVHVNEYYYKWCYQKALATIDKYSIKIQRERIHYFIFSSHLGDVMGLLPYVSLFFEFRNNPSIYLSDSSEAAYELYCKVIDTADQIVAITRKSNVGVCKLCPTIDDIIVVSNEELEALQFYSYNERNFVNIYPDPHHSYPNHLLFQVAIQEDYCKYSYWCYGLRNCVYSRKFISEYRHVIPQDSKDNAIRYMKENSIDSKRTVVICPHAKSTAEFPNSFWHKIIHILQSEGFFVMVNVGPNEQTDLNVKTICESIDITCALGELGVVFLGVQSGLLDVLRFFSDSIRTVSLYAIETLYDVAVKKIVSGDQEKNLYRKGKYSIIYIDNKDYKTPKNIPNEVVSIRDENELIQCIKDELVYVTV